MRIKSLMSAMVAKFGCGFLTSFIEFILCVRSLGVVKYSTKSNLLSAPRFLEEIVVILEKLRYLIIRNLSNHAAVAAEILI